MEETSRWTIRANWQGNYQTSVYARNNSFSIQRQFSYREADNFPSALEYLLGALAGDLIAGFEVQASRQRISLEAIEISLNGRLNNPLMALGVIGETEGHAGLERIEGRIYLSTEAEEEQLQNLWQQVRLSSPLFQTLNRALELHLELRLTL
jgi:hypothetical protein